MLASLNLAHLPNREKVFYHYPSRLRLGRNGTHARSDCFAPRNTRGSPKGFQPDLRAGSLERPGRHSPRSLYMLMLA